MNVLDARLCLMLHSLPGLGNLTLARLFLHYGSAGAIWDSDPRQWRPLGAATETIEAARAARAANAAQPQIERQVEVLQRLDAQVISLNDPGYPALLATLYDPPPILYVRGEAALLQQAQLAIVGSRKFSPPGRRAALELSGALVRAGLHVCSGLAIGIDQAAHRGALDAGGKTLAVMATGLDVVYPGRHRGLAEEVVQSGCLLTEFPPGARPLRQRFPQRNRIISGLSLGVLIAEAALRSGSLITARTAMEQGREVFALPWSMYHPGGRGCLALIRDGAKMVQGIEDILEELGPLYHCQRELQRPESTGHPGGIDRPENESVVLGLIGSEAVTVDELVECSGLTVARVLSALTVLEVNAEVCRCEGGYIHS
jgi:DNA processing protein